MARAINSENQVSVPFQSEETTALPSCRQYPITEISALLMSQERSYETKADLGLPRSAVIYFEDAPHRET